MTTINTDVSKVVLVSRTDNIGDMILTLPAIYFLKKEYPQCKIILLGRPYIKPVVEASGIIDKFLDWQALSTQSDTEIGATFKQLKIDTIFHAHPNERIAKLTKAIGIKTRVGIVNKKVPYNLRYCNRRLLMRNRKFHRQHESVRCLKLLKKLGIQQKYQPEELINHVTLKPLGSLNTKLANLIDPTKFNLILHPGSNGNAPEWPGKNFAKLYHLLDKSQFKIFITGTEKEQERFKKTLINRCPGATNLIGKINLTELLTFISRCDGLIAASTGPLHIAAAIGIHCLGIFTPKRQVSPKNWRPIGPKAEFLVSPTKCPQCRAKQKDQCTCIELVTPKQVYDKVMEWEK